MGNIAVFKGTKLRATKTDACGKPISGAAHRIVTDCWVGVKADPEMKQAEELELQNAEGGVIFADRTAAERKRYNVTLEVGGVDPDLFALLCSWARILDYDGNPIGVRDRKKVENEFGVALEFWTAGRSEKDCVTPTSDTGLASTGSNKSYGYLLLVASEFYNSSGFDIRAAITAFTLAGITIDPVGWGRGPYNVQERDSSGSPGRLLVPAYDAADENHLNFFRTKVPPPAVTNGAVALDLTGPGKFEGTTYYYGDPSGNTTAAADVAPSQDDASGYVLAFTGSPDGGSHDIVVTGSATPAVIAYNATNTAAKAVFAALDDGHTAAEWTVTGGALPGSPLTIIPPIGVTLTLGDNDLTAPSGTPAATLTAL